MLSFIAPPAPPHSIDYAAEAIALSIRWFGLVVGWLLVAVETSARDASALCAILSLGLVFTAVNTAFYLRGRLFLRDWPLLISAMEALFIGLLCYYGTGLDSPFRFYYLLSLICCAIRHSPRVTFITFGMDCLSYGLLYFTAPVDGPLFSRYLLTIVVLVWVTWAAGALARLLKRTEAELRGLNEALQKEQGQLESRILDRTKQLEESQAQVLHQEKMAAFGLLAAGIAHEVGNPLTGISGVVQMLERRDLDEYTRDKLTLVTGELSRIQKILRELILFSRPASEERSRLNVRDVLEEALGIAKYYKGGKNRQLVLATPGELPAITGVRDQLVQVVFNLVLNAIDATGKGGRIEVAARHEGNQLVVTVADDGQGIPAEVQTKLFRPYFTTKRHGTGLGLFVIRRITEAHGGTVELVSQPGEGATFRVTLPVSDAFGEPDRSPPGRG
jgi:signal transduction histidine kinase